MSIERGGYNEYYKMTQKKKIVFIINTWTDDNDDLNVPLFISVTTYRQAVHVKCRRSRKKKVKTSMASSFRMCRRPSAS